MSMIVRHITSRANRLSRSSGWSGILKRKQFHESYRGFAGNGAKHTVRIFGTLKLTVLSSSGLLKMTQTLIILRIIVP